MPSRFLLTGVHDSEVWGNPGRYRTLRRILFKNEFTVYFVVATTWLLARAFKLHTAGVVYDEATTFRLFGASVGQALGYYPFPNNHVLNSLLICITGKFFSDYEHYIRLPVFFFGSLSVIPVFYICRKLVLSNELRLVMFCCILFNNFLFDFSILARGYGIGMFAGQAYLALLVAVRYSSARLSDSRFRIGIVFATSVLNFIALGSSLTSVFEMVACNVVLMLTILCADLGTLRQRFKLALLNGAQIFLLTSLLFFGLYRLILVEISQQTRLAEHPGAEFYNHMVSVGSLLLSVVQDVVPEVVTCSLLLCCIAGIALPFTMKRGSAITGDSGLARRIVAIHAIAVFVLLSIYWLVLGKKIGYARNSIFLVFILQLLLFSAADVLFQWTKSKLFLVVAILGFVATSVINLPSFTLVDVEGWQTQSCSKAIVKTLTRVSPEQQWKVRTPQGTQWLGKSLRWYYGKFYKVNSDYKDPHNAVVQLPDQALPGAGYIEQKVVGCENLIRLYIRSQS